MRKTHLFPKILLPILGLLASCQSLTIELNIRQRPLPERFLSLESDSGSVAQISWRDFFKTRFCLVL